MQSTSLSAYCKAHNLPKASVHKFLKGEGFDTREGMTAEAIAAADGYFLDAPQSSPAQVEIVLGEGRLGRQLGTHRAVLAYWMRDFGPAAPGWLGQ